MFEYNYWFMEMFISLSAWKNYYKSEYRIYQISFSVLYIFFYIYQNRLYKYLIRQWINLSYQLEYL